MKRKEFRLKDEYMQARKKQEEAEWKGEGEELECFSSAGTTNRADLESLRAA